MSGQRLQLLESPAQGRPFEKHPAADGQRQGVHGPPVRLA